MGVPTVIAEGVQQPLRLAAREGDATVGLYQVRARWYDPVTARFVSEDPIGLAGGINPYAYASNNPVSFRDPSGLCEKAKICLPPVIAIACPPGSERDESHKCRPTGGGGMPVVPGVPGAEGGPRSGGGGSMQQPCPPLLQNADVRRAGNEAWERSRRTRVEEGAWLIPNAFGPTAQSAHARGAGQFTSISLASGRCGNVDPNPIPRSPTLIPPSSFVVLHTHLQNCGGNTYQQRPSPADSLFAVNTGIPVVAIAADSVFVAQPNGQIRGCRR